jgi:hypothetical protein
MSRLFRPLLSLLALLAILSCGSPPPANPASLWLSYAQSELNLVLVDHEPPAF